MRKNAGFWLRVLAYLIDIFPIVILVAGVFYFFFGFDEILKARFSQIGNKDIRAEFLSARNHIRDISFAIWILYSTILECTPFQGTFGKKAIGLKVVDREGMRLSPYRSMGRNLFKFLSLIALGIGFIWVAFSKNKQGWHDLAAKTYVIRS